MANGRTKIRLILRLALVAVALFLLARRSGWLGPGGSVSDGPSPRIAAEASAVDRAWAERRSGVVVDAEGVVERTLDDDDQGSRHQRFILKLESGLTVLVAHNIDLAPRIALSRGDAVQLRGEYEWNSQGGVIHWTHRDPAGRHPDGFIRHDGQVYR